MLDLTYRLRVEKSISQARSNYNPREKPKTLVAPHPFSFFLFWRLLRLQDCTDWERSRQDDESNCVRKCSLKQHFLGNGKKFLAYRIPSTAGQ